MRMPRLDGFILRGCCVKSAASSQQPAVNGITVKTKAPWPPTQKTKEELAKLALGSSVAPTHLKELKGQTPPDSKVDYFDRLPLELIGCVLHHSDLASLINVSGVSSSCHDAFKQEVVPLLNPSFKDLFRCLKELNISCLLIDLHQIIMDPP